MSGKALTIHAAASQNRIVKQCQIHHAWSGFVFRQEPQPPTNRVFSKAQTRGFLKIALIDQLSISVLWKIDIWYPGIVLGWLPCGTQRTLQTIESIQKIPKLARQQT